MFDISSAIYRRFCGFKQVKVSIPHEKTSEENLIFVVCYAD